ncbi:MAG TPA: efflux RND transporter periplasmic adaptor subunit [Longimicrobiaceae bacterium]|jgi:multidrug efflux system membrane fusion protein|nr:efflux RND transporter periplasmic adaptor subunit [Longimicrobiaceae bacterium]
MKLSRLPLVSATLVLALAAGCSKPPQRPKEKVPVTVAPATVQSVPYTITANGTVEPLQSVAVQPQVSGPIVEVLFHEGDEVREGQVLFRLDPRPFQAELAKAQADLTRDRVLAANAAREAERYGSLVAKGYVTQSQADQLRSAAAAQQAVLAGDAAAVQAAQLNLNYATIRAPISGRTGGLLVKPGNVVRAPNPTPLVEINQIEPVLVRFTVPGRTLADLQRAVRPGAGLTVTAMPTAADSTGAHVAQMGRLDFLDNAVDTTTGSIALKARFPNTSRVLWPGQFLTVTMDLFRQDNALTVPAAAVQTGQDGSYVFVIDEQNKAKMTPITVSRTAGEVAVVASGLAPGMRVVTDGQSRLTPGAQVVIKGPGGGAGRPGGTPAGA